MKTKTWIILIAAILVVSIGLSLPLLLGQSPASAAKITLDGKVIATLDLSLDQVLEVPTPDGGFNTVTVKNGKIAVTDTNCPDQYCVHRGFCNSGAPVVCLPHKLIITFVGPTEIDGVVG